MEGTKPLVGETAIVTGASSGIGRATAKRLAACGASVVLASRSESRLTDLRDEIEADGGTALVAPTDVRSCESVTSTVDATVDRFGGIDIVVSNAGVVAEGDVPFTELSEEAFRTTIGTNVNGSFFVAQQTLPHLRKSEGRLVFVGSAAANGPRPALPVYAATKWWLRGFARSIETLAGDDGVTVSLLNPSEVATNIGSDDGDDESLHEKRDEDEILSSTDVAEAVVFMVTRRPHVAVSELDLYRQDKRSYLYR